MDFIATETATASDFLSELGFLRGNLNNACYPVLWNLIGSHDTSRALNRCAGDKEKLRLLVAMQLLLPGMPFIYYGDEVGLTGGGDPDCRRGMLWDTERQDHVLFDYYRRLIGIRKTYPCLTEGEPLEQIADDATGTVIIDRGELVLVFHGRTGTVSLPQYQGLPELISQESFSGFVNGRRTLVLQK
jgi:glycosidase